MKIIKLQVTFLVKVLGSKAKEHVRQEETQGSSKTSPNFVVAQVLNLLPSDNRIILDGQ